MKLKMSILLPVCTLVCSALGCGILAYDDLDAKVKVAGGVLAFLMGALVLSTLIPTGAKPDNAAIRRQREQQFIEDVASGIRGMIETSGSIRDLLETLDMITTFQVTFNGFHNDEGNTQAAAWVDSLRLALSRRQREILARM